MTNKMTQKTYSGKGINELMETCKKHSLNPYNSDLHIKNPSDLDSEWIVTVK